MKIKSFFICFLFLWMLSFSCTNKKLKMDIEEIECKDLKLSNAQFDIIHEPCSLTTQPLTQTAIIRFDHNQKRRCLENIIVNALFKDINGNLIFGVTYQSRYSPSSPDITLTDNYLELRFIYTLASQIDANNLKNIEIELFTSNAIDNESNKLNFTIPVDCRRNLNNGGGNNYTVVRNVNVNSQFVNIILRDYGQEDGDIVNVYLNGNLELSNVLITNAGRSFNIVVNPGINDLVLIAVNEGSIPPNTCELIVNNGSGIRMSPGLQTGQAVRITF
ncbi:MAG: hypothetical protein SNJ77_06760 [Cytophagales bacterium]